ncbi:glutamine amidotransferase [Flexivirga caeni]|uniref:Cytoplasmic protein n=1 Tax=Flexivirga caeni TaxID=2294115 RepID=A0A3M9MFA9_9MICO|nr:glutamine amidotransferase [Flexivirga caeni]RNI24239.1 cytoplasmic protein [Flexivirga caeni]
MNNPKVLLAGETWITQATHIKGVDSFTTSSLESGAEAFIKVLTDDGFCTVDHLMGHDVPKDFPASADALSAYDVIVLSDIGSRSFLLHPDTWLSGKPTVDRLELLRDWVKGGGGFAMVGGYLSFQGLDGAARYGTSALADVLPAVLQERDDCVEVPAGATPVVEAGHEIVDGMPPDWPILLGYNRFRPRPGADIVCTLNGDPLLTVMEAGQGRSLAWASDMGPHWCPDTFTSWAGFRNLWRGAVTWLSRSN